MSDHLEYAINALKMCGEGNTKSQLLGQISYAIGQLRIHQSAQQSNAAELLPDSFEDDREFFEGISAKGLR